MCARPPVCGRACTKPNPTLSVKSDEEQGRGAWRMSVLLRAVCACVYKLATLRCRARAAGRGRLGAPGVGVGSAPAGQSPSRTRSDRINAQNTIASMRESSRAHENPASSQRTSVRHRRSDHVGWPSEHVHR